MQAEDFQHLCEADLIDIIAYLRVVPAIERPDRASHAGPVFAVLAALNQLPPQLFSVEFSDHTQPLPPAVREAVTPEFGRYLYDNTCTGCHRPDHRGGKIKGSPPDWFPAANLTQDALSDWTEAGFIKTLRTGVNPSGSQLRNPMTKTLKYTPKYSETELKALWIYLKTVKGSEEF
jgi:cytochrome c5